MYKRQPHAREEIAESYFPAFERPLAALFFVLGVYWAISYLPLNPEQKILLVRLFRTSLIIVIAWGFYNLTGSYSSFLKNFGHKLNIDFDEILIPLLSKTFRFIIIALAIAIVAGEWGYDINGFIAGLGLGGLAIALAAKDAIANIFAGIVILVDKPFSVGDWISTVSIEGTVEEVSFRSTRTVSYTHLKGLELAAYEPRGAVGHGLGYAVSNRGGCHLSGGYVIFFEANGPITVDPYTCLLYTSRCV